MIDRKCYKSFLLHNIPEWPCPLCQAGFLELKKKDIITFEPEASQALHSHEAWEPDWITEKYYGVGTCINPKCKEKIIITGDGTPKRNPEWDPRDEISDEYIYYYTAKYFSSSLPLFNIPESVEDNIKVILHASFNIFFCSPNSAANQARIALEKLIDILRINKYALSKGKRYKLSLDNRIKLLPKKYEREKKMFMAIKWLGNVGSHDIDITHEDLLDLYSIFEKLLNDVYEQHGRKILKLADAVIKHKGRKKK